MKKVSHIKNKSRIKFLVRQAKWLILLAILVPLHSSLFSQIFNIEGIIYDELLNPLEETNIVLNNGEFTTVSNHNGEFKFIDIPNKEYALQVSYLGFKNYFFKILPDQDKIFIKIELETLSQTLNEITIQFDSEKNLKKTSSNNIQLVNKDYLEQNYQGSIMQTLRNIPGVNSIDIGSGISKPMIRGLSNYRVVVAENGIKQEGQQWSAHHGLELDQFAIEEIEIIKGPASLQYGSGAIGGIINILPGSIPEPESTEGEIMMIGKTNSEWLGVSGKFETRHKDLFLTASCTYNNYADYKVPADSFEYKPMHYAYLGGEMTNTAGREFATNLRTGLIKKWGINYLSINHYYHHNGFFAMASGQELLNFNISKHHSDNRDILLPNQKVKHTEINYFSNLVFGVNSLKIAIGFQNNFSQEFDWLEDISGSRHDDLVKYGSNNLDLQYKLLTYSGNTSFSINKTNQLITIGLNSQFQQNTTDGFNHLLPEYSQFNAGLFITHKYNLSEKLILNSGIRLDYSSIQIKETLNPDPLIGDSIFNPEINTEYPSFVFAAGFNYLPNANLMFKVNIAKSFRTPAAYELASYGIHKHTLRFEKGDPNLKPEQSYQFEIGFEISKSHFSFSLSPFINYFTNYIYLAPTPDFMLGTFTGQVYEYRQNKAILAGGEFQTKIKPIKYLSIEIKGEYVYAVNLDLASALPYTPPLSILTGVLYSPQINNFFTNNRLGFEVLAVASQNMVAINEYPTEGYLTFNFLAKTKVLLGKQEVKLMLSIYNLFNSKYFNHLSYYRRLQIPEPSRNIQLKISIPIKGNKHKSDFK